MGRETDQKAPTVNALSEFARLATDEGDLRGAAARCQEALALSREIASKVREAARDLACAEIAIEQGRLEEAERLAKSAQVDATDKRVPAEGAAFHTLSQAYLAGAKLADARRAFDPARTVRHSVTAQWYVRHDNRAPPRRRRAGRGRRRLAHGGRRGHQERLPASGLRDALVSRAGRAPGESAAGGKGGSRASTAGRRRKRVWPDRSESGHSA